MLIMVQSLDIHSLISLLISYSLERFSLVAEVALRMTGHQQLFRDQRKGKWCDTLLLARARILSGQVRARQNSAKIRALAKSRVSHHFPFLWTRENVWRQRRGGLRMRVWAAKFKQFLTILALFFRILTIFFATHHYNWFWSTKFGYRNKNL